MKTTSLKAVAALLPVLLSLSACNKSETTEKQPTDAGEILPGSASDAMLPYDSVRSRPPADLSAEQAKGTASDEITAVPEPASSESTEEPRAEEAEVSAKPVRPAATATPVRPNAE